MPKALKPPTKSYRCHRCSRLFARSEHLQRHERSQICSRGTTVLPTFRGMHHSPRPPLQFQQLDLLNSL
ncbi:hypothetical protein CI102_5498 [Trichoderma harzianum]|nr:hypothetical protein CI102_5498 [Trichoderma harzianum]